jgi:hypothetical protein
LGCDRAIASIGGVAPHRAGADRRSTKRFFLAGHIAAHTPWLGAARSEDRLGRRREDLRLWAEMEALWVVRRPAETAGRGVDLTSHHFKLLKPLQSANSPTKSDFSFQVLKTDD